MRITDKLYQLLILTLSFCFLLSNCGQIEKEAIDSYSKDDVREEVEAESNGVPQFEVVLPDSGLMENVNPEEIITDDWNSESPDAASDQE